MPDDQPIAPKGGADASLLVAYQGVPGAFGETAVHRYWRDRARPFPTPTFVAALEAVRKGEATHAVIPVWNSSIGSVVEGCAALDQCEARLIQVDEIEVPVDLCLIARPEASMRDIRFVGSHPTALAQCKRFFAECRGMAGCMAFNTAGAVRDVACYDAIVRASDPSALLAWYSHLHFDSPIRLAAIASERAAHYYGLAVLRRSVQDDPTNRTRFVVLRAGPLHVSSV